MSESGLDMVASFKVPVVFAKFSVPEVLSTTLGLKSRTSESLNDSPETGLVKVGIWE